MNRNHIIYLECRDSGSWECLTPNGIHATINKAKGEETLDGSAIQAPMTLNFDVRYSPLVAAMRMNTQNYRIRYGADGAGRPAYFKVTAYDDYFERRRNVRLTGVSYRG